MPRFFLRQDCDACVAGFCGAVAMGAASAAIAAGCALLFIGGKK